MKKSIAICVVVGLILAARGVAQADVRFEKSRDVHLKVWNTILGNQVGDPILDVDLPSDMSTTIDHAWWATDLSVQQHFISSGIVAHQALAAIVEDSSGQFSMPLLDSWLMANVGEGQIPFVDLTSETTDIHVGISIAEWVAGGAPRYAWESTIPVVGGTSALLPGYKVGLAPISFDPNSGWVNPNPYTGSVTNIGTMTMAVPEPSTFALLGIGTIGLLVCAWRRRKCSAT